MMTIAAGIFLVGFCCVWIGIVRSGERLVDYMFTMRRYKTDIVYTLNFVVERV